LFIGTLIFIHLKFNEGEFLFSENGLLVLNVKVVRMIDNLVVLELFEWLTSEVIIFCSFPIFPRRPTSDQPKVICPMKWQQIKFCFEKIKMNSKKSLLEIVPSLSGKSC
jgi:hypothetical protein